jgi:sugar (pentulose or hexulose) kinase
VVVGPADRPAEAVGAGATDRSPLVSWGTTANVSVPLDNRPDRRPHGIVLSRGAVGGWLLEGGLSAAGSLLAWIGGLTGRGPEELAVLAARCPPGARGVTATPWLEGARAPWWQPEARVALAGLDAAHGPGELARAAIEAVAWEVGLVLGGGGSALPVWCEVLTGITGLPAIRRRSGQAASAGTAVVTARAVGLDLEVDGFDPVVERHEPDPAAVARYAELRARSDLLAADAMAWAGGPVRPGPPAPGGHRTGEPV